jgi:hypothetical protein
MFGKKAVLPNARPVVPDVEDLPAEEPAAVEEPISDEEQERRDFAELQKSLRREYINSLKASGRLQEHKRNIQKWVVDHKILNNRDFESDWYSSRTTARVNDDLYIDVDKDITIVGENLVALSSEPGINFGTVKGNVIVGHCTLPTLPPGIPREVSRNFTIENMRNLTSLVGGPSAVRGNDIVMRCPNLNSLDGAPISADDFDGYFQNEKFTDDDFYCYNCNRVVSRGNEVLSKDITSDDDYYLDEPDYDSMVNNGEGICLNCTYWSVSPYGASYGMVCRRGYPTNGPGDSCSDFVQSHSFANYGDSGQYQFDETSRDISNRLYHWKNNR